MLTVCSKRIYLHPALHNFSIEMRELCQKPWSKYAYIPLAGYWVNAIMHSVFDNRLLPRADEKQIV